MVTMTVVASPPWIGRREGSIVSRNCAKCLSHPLGIGHPGERVGVLFGVGSSVRSARVGVGLEVGGEPGADCVGHASRDPRGAVAQAPQREPGEICGVGFELGESRRLCRLGDLGCDDIEDPPTEPAQLLRPELGGVGDEPRLGQRDRVGVHRAWQGRQGTVDHV